MSEERNIQSGLSAQEWSVSLSLQNFLTRIVLPLVLVLSLGSYSMFVFSEKLVEQIILDQVQKQAEVMLIGVNRQLYVDDVRLESGVMELLFQQVIEESKQHYTFLVNEIYLYDRDGRVVAHSDGTAHPPKEIKGKYQQVLVEGTPYLGLKGGTESNSRTADIIVPVSYQGVVVAGLEAELDLIQTEQMISKADDEFEEMMQIIILLVVLSFAAVMSLLLWSKLVRPAQKRHKVMQASVNQAYDEVSAKDDFLSSMSHELRTPLSSIIGYGEVLRDTPLNAEQEKMISSMNLAGKSLLALVNDILDLSKISSGKFEIDRALFDLSDVTQEMKMMFKQKAEMHHLQFGLEGDVACATMLEGDGRRIAQVLINLIGNAVKFTSVGGITLKVTTEPPQEVAGQQVVLYHFSVNDSGIGMSPEAQSRLFKAYEQADNTISSRFGGTGLGLHISWKLAELMGGTIVVSSVEGEGSTFDLVIPLVVTDQPVIVRASRQQQLESRLQGRVLVAEDTPELQLLERKLIESTGADVEFANDGEEAVAMALEQPYDLVLMDMLMPKMDGVEATRLLRSTGLETPIYALTANAMQHHRDQFDDAGCDGFLTKPIDRFALLEVLRAHLEADDREGSAIEQAASGSLDDVVDPEMMEVFLRRLQEAAQELKQYYEDGAWDELRRVVHTLKGTAATFGFPEITALAKEAEECLLSEQWDALKDGVDALQQTIKSICSGSDM